MKFFRRHHFLQGTKVAAFVLALLLLCACVNNVPKQSTSSVPIPSLPVAVKNAPVPEAPVQVRRDPADAFSYLADTSTAWKAFTTGVLNPQQGTIELTVRIDKDYSEFGNNWESLFNVVPQHEGPGNELFSAMTQPPPGRPANGQYEQPLLFLVRNGVSQETAYASIPPERMNYEQGVPFNLAFVWNLGGEGYTAVYMNGEEVDRAPTQIAEVLERYLSYQIVFSRAAPFYISQVKISTRALDAGELESTTGNFSRAEDTSLLADITFGQPVEQAYYTTPWHTETAFSGVKPVADAALSTFFAGEEIYCPLLLLNRGEAASTYEITAEGSNQYGEASFYCREEVEIPNDGAFHIYEMPLNISEAGFYDYSLTVSGPNGTVIYDRQLTITPLPASIPDGSYSNFYGQHVNVDCSREPYQKMNARLIRAWDTGLATFSWYNIEPKDNQFEWDVADRYVEEALQLDMDVCAVLGNPGTWASSRPNPADTMDLPEENTRAYRAGTFVSKDIKAGPDGTLGNGELWRDYVYQVMKRYAGKVKYYEIVNEADFRKDYLPVQFNGTDKEYFLMLQIAGEEAQRVREEYLAETGGELDLYVTTSGFSSLRFEGVDYQMTLDVLKEDKLNFYDIYSVHGYAGVDELADTLSAFRQAKQQKPDLLLWQGEYYTTEYAELSPTEYVFQVVENVMGFLAAGADRYIGMGGPSPDGIMRFGNTPTAIFQVNAVMQQQIRKAESYIGRLNGFVGKDNLPVREMLLRTDESILTVLGSNQARQLTLANPEAVLSVVDAYGCPVVVENNMLAKQNCLFVISTEPLEIGGVE